MEETKAILEPLGLAPPSRRIATSFRVNSDRSMFPLLTALCFRFNRRPGHARKGRAGRMVGAAAGCCSLTQRPDCGQLRH